MTATVGTVAALLIAGCGPDADPTGTTIPTETTIDVTTDPPTTIPPTPTPHPTSPTTEPPSPHGSSD